MAVNVHDMGDLPSMKTVENNTGNTDLVIHKAEMKGHDVSSELIDKGEIRTTEENLLCKECHSETEEHLLTFEMEEDALASEPLMVRPDGGWGWLVAVGAFLMLALIPTTSSSFGILFSKFLVDREASSTTTASIFNLQSCLWFFMGPIVSPLTSEFGWRKIGYCGVLFASLSLITSAFSPSVGLLFFTFSFLSGIGTGFSTIICYAITPQYFEHCQGIPNMLVMTGSCMSQIVGPLLARYLLDEYGFRGGAFLFGAILLNGFVAASVFHPIEWHMKKAADLKKNQIPQSVFSSVERNKMPQTNSEANNASNILPQESKKPESISVKKINDKKSLVLFERTGTKGRVKILRDVVFRLIRKTIHDLKVLKMYKAIIISVSITLSTISCLNFSMVLPFAMGALDYTLEDASYLLLILGLTNIITRLFISPLIDWHRFNIQFCVMAGYGLVSAAMFLFPFLKTMGTMMAASVLLGCGAGGHDTLNNIIILKYVGRENHFAMLGVTTLMIGVSSFLFGPFIGFVRDATGSFAIAIWILSAMEAGSFTLWLFMTAAIRKDSACANIGDKNIS